MEESGDVLCQHYPVESSRKAGALKPGATSPSAGRDGLGNVRRVAGLLSRPKKSKT